MAGAIDVAFFTDTTGYGGAEKSLLTLIEGLDRRRWRPILIHPADDAVAPFVAAARELGAELWPVARMPEGWDGAARVLPFTAALRRRRPAVFHAHLTWSVSCKFGLVAALLARVPAVLATEHAFVDVPLTKPTRLQLRVLGRGVGSYVAVSSHVKCRLVETFGWPESKIVVIPNGVNLDRCRVAADPALRDRLSNHGRRRVLLALSRLDPRKGLRFLLEAAKPLDGVQVVIAGDGPERQELELLARELGIADRVRLLGYRDDVQQLLACCDVFVQPSLNEAFGLGALEAMCAQKPIVATAVGGTPELLSAGETALLVAPGDSDALAQAIQSLIEDPVRAQALGRAARSRAESFSRERMVSAVTQVYDDLLDASR